AQSRLRVIDRRAEEDHYLKQKEDIYGVSLGYNPDFDTDTLRYVFSSFESPPRTIDYHLGDKGKRLVREKKNRVYAGKYVTRREWATAPDGTQVPITLVYTKWRGGGSKTDHKRLYLTAYGAYGAGSEPGYSDYVHALLKRGFTYAIAHVRGGDDLGMEWYKAGSMLRKKNTFTDFIACAEHLIDQGYTTAGAITAQGGSAGGLLMGVIANERPDLFRAVVLDVPFVDVINTMLDDKLPLTTGEYLEWGNPRKKKYFEYMYSYSPYDNVVAQDYPHLFFYTGLNDTRVGYWEPAKMVAKLRALKTDDNLLLLKTDFSGGHGGGSGRYAGLRESAYKLALLFDLYDREERADK
ncbi:MAG: prolyl oligopeptidase family serine peptidase, partial [Bacteroidota bacterium]